MPEREKTMKTAHWVRISSIIMAVFGLFWAASMVFFALCHINFDRTFGDIGGKLAIVWALIPVLPALIVGLVYSIKERNDPECGSKLGKQRALLILFLACYLVLFVAGCVLAVKLTGL